MNSSAYPLLVKELLIDREPLGWLTEFANTAHSKKPTDIVHSLVQMGVTGTTDCGCRKEGELHRNHHLYNRVVWEILMSHPGLIGKLRRVLKRDIDGPTDQRLLETCKAEYGKIARKEYSRELLDNFLMQKPNPSWVGPM